MPTPTAYSPALPATWTLHTAPVITPSTPLNLNGERALPAYAELDPALARRSRITQEYFNEQGRYSEDTHPDSVKQLDSQRPASLPPTYWQATGHDSPLPEHVENDAPPPTYDEAVDTGGVRFCPSLNGQHLAQAMKHVYRLDQLLEQAEQLGTLLLERDQAGGTSIDAEQVAVLCQKIDRLRSSWANGAFAGTSRLGTQLASHLFPVARTSREGALNAAIDNLWRTAKTEYQDRYLTDPLNADPILAKVYIMVEGLKKAEI